MNMPRISTFYGIIVMMFWDDHNPPHFHVKYNEFKAIISIDEIKVLNGNLPNKAWQLIKEWTLLHQKELRENWNLGLMNQPFKEIEPLI